jgi:uncharacterized integral membrane protein
MTQQIVSETYQGQFGEFTIDKSDRLGVIIYRTGLAIAALSFAIGSTLVLPNPHPGVFPALTPLFFCFCGALGVSLLTIHIYLAVLHRVLQIFWAIGTIAAVAIALSNSTPLAVTVYEHPITLLGVGFIFAALTGIYFKEAFCFNRFETKAVFYRSSGNKSCLVRGLYYSLSLPFVKQYNQFHLILVINPCLLI